MTPARKLAGEGAAVVVDDRFAERLVQTGVDAFGGLDIVVNNAGYTWDSVVWKMSDEQWDAILDVYLKAPFRILRAPQPVISRAGRRRRGSSAVRAGEPRELGGAGANGLPLHSRRRRRCCATLVCVADPDTLTQHLVDPVPGGIGAPR